MYIVYKPNSGFGYSPRHVTEIPVPGALEPLWGRLPPSPPWPTGGARDPKGGPRGPKGAHKDPSGIHKGPRGPTRAQRGPHKLQLGTYAIKKHRMTKVHKILGEPSVQRRYAYYVQGYD